MNRSRPDPEVPTASGETREGGMLRADELTVVHHDDTVQVFRDVRYMLGRRGLWVVLAGGEEILFPLHDVLTTYARAAARTGTPEEYAIAA
jgi:hypothetical protein